MAMFICLNLPLIPVFTDTDDESSTTKSRSNAHGVLRLDFQKQLESGLKIQPAKSAQAQYEYETTGKVISFEPLIALRERYMLARAEQKAARARMNRTQQSLTRQEELFKNGISSKRSLLELEAQQVLESSSVDAAEVKITAITSEVRLNWGEVLSEWALSDTLNNFKPFLSGHEFLLLITLPANKRLPKDLSAVQVNDSGRRGETQKALLIGKASQIDVAVQGESYFFRVKSEKYRAGMKLSVWVPVSHLDDSGIFVPESALIWYMDQAYVYVKEDNDNFVRRSVTGFNAVPGGYHIKDGLSPGEELVTSGAQMLLSEELRQQIPDEDE